LEQRTASFGFDLHTELYSRSVREQEQQQQQGQEQDQVPFGQFNGQHDLLVQLRLCVLQQAV